MRKLIFSLISLISMFSLNAQTLSPQLLSSTGESFKNLIYLMDWSIGEVQTETYSANGHLLTQGFHQSKYAVATAVNNINGLQFEITAFPNPTTDYVNLKVESIKVENLQYSITDLSGIELLNRQFLGNIEQINFSNFAIGSYFISILQKNRLIKSFKIIKK